MSLYYSDTTWMHCTLQHLPQRAKLMEAASESASVAAAQGGGGGNRLRAGIARSRLLERSYATTGDFNTVKKSPPTFVQAGPMDPWALMQKALLDALVL